MVGGEVLTVVHDDGADLAKDAVVEDLANHVELRQELRPHRLARKQSSSARGCEYLRCLSGVDAQRLFDQDVLTGGQRSQRTAAVFDVWGGDVDDVDVGIGQQ